MQIAVLGTGTVGRTLAGRLDELGHDVRVATRDVAATMARTAADAMGNPPYPVWAGQHPRVRLTTFADATADLFVNATAGTASLPALHAVGTDNLAGRIVLDVANPLDYSTGMPPSLFTGSSDSLGEQIQAEFPAARVVKSLNTITAALMVHPEQLADGDHTVYLSGNDAAAKQTVLGLLESFGHTDIVDLGDISTARGTEMIMPLWLRLMGRLGTPIFSFKLVR